MSPEDPCGRCGCLRKYHDPPKYYSYAKTGASSGNSKNLPIIARTCCWDCPHCICFCVRFLEPGPDTQPYHAPDREALLEPSW